MRTDGIHASNDIFKETDATLILFWFNQNHYKGKSNEYLWWVRICNVSTELGFSLWWWWLWFIALTIATKTVIEPIKSHQLALKCLNSFDFNWTNNKRRKFYRFILQFGGGCECDKSNMFQFRGAHFIVGYYLGIFSGFPSSFHLKWWLKFLCEYLCTEIEFMNVVIYVVLWIIRKLRTKRQKIRIIAQNWRVTNNRFAVISIAW